MVGNSKISAAAVSQAISERDAQIERLTKERDEALAETAKVAALAEDLMNDKLPSALETISARAETAERERDEARAEVEAWKALDAEMGDLLDKFTDSFDLLMANPAQFVTNMRAHYAKFRAALTAKGGENAEG